MATLGAVGAVPADAQQRLVRRNLIEQAGLHGHVAAGVVSHLERTDLQALGNDAQMHRVPLAQVVSAVLAGLPLAQHLDAGAVHQQVGSVAQRAAVQQVG